MDCSSDLNKWFFTRFGKREIGGVYRFFAIHILAYIGCHFVITIPFLGWVLMILILLWAGVLGLEGISMTWKLWSFVLIVNLRTLCWSHLNKIRQGGYLRLRVIFHLNLTLYRWWIWKTKVPSRVQVLVWIIAQLVIWFRGEDPMLFSPLIGVLCAKKKQWVRLICFCSLIALTLWNLDNLMWAGSLHPIGVTL